MTKRREIVEVLLIGFIATLAMVPAVVWLATGGLPEWLLHEGGAYEHGSALASLAASLVFFLASQRSRDGLDSRDVLERLWLLAMSVGAFVLAGEEVSWGQHLFGWEPPEIVRANNFQGEMNLHNLSLFQPSNNAVSSWLFRLLVAYLSLLPIAVRIFPTLRRIVAATRFPVPSLSIALATTLATTGVGLGYKVVYGHAYAADAGHHIGETMESLVQLCLLWLAVERLRLLPARGV